MILQRVSEKKTVPELFLITPWNTVWFY